MIHVFLYTLYICLYTRLSMFHINFRSTKKEFFKTACASLMSLIAIHVAVIVIHEHINEATPKNTFAYLLDKGMEYPETLWASLGGSISLVEAHLAKANERIEEAEHLIEEEQSHSGALLHQDVTAQTNALFTDSYQSLIRANTLMEKAVSGDAHDIHLFTIALLSESAHKDIVRRMEMIRFVYEKQNNTGIDTEVISKIEDLMGHSTELVALFDIEEDVQNDIRLIVKNTPPFVRNADSLSEEFICRQKNESCSTNADCCSNAGLECTNVILSSGQRGKRCLQPTVSVCQIDCMQGEEGNSWGEAYRCQSTVLTSDLPRCKTLSDKSCTYSVNESRNTRECIDA